MFIAFRIFFNAGFYYPVFTILFLDFGLTLERRFMIRTLDRCKVAGFIRGNRVPEIEVIIFFLSDGNREDKTQRNNHKPFQNLPFVGLSLFKRAKSAVLNSNSTLDCSIVNINDEY